MPRTGITREQVFDAANRLMQRGQQPSVARIRAALGSGSFSTIHQYFQDWKSFRWHTENNLDWVPQAIEGKAKELLHIIWDLAARDAGEEIERLVAEYQRETIQLQKQLVRAKEDNSRLEQEIDRLQAQLRLARSP